jgi:hypothetical protein
MLVFDIETGPLSDEDILARSDKFEFPEHPGEFDEASVKLGNLKDPAKRQAKVDEYRERHAAAVDKYESTVDKARKDWWEEIISKAALSPITGQILAIGYFSTDTGKHILDIDGEADMCARFWQQYKKCKAAGRKMCGHNIAYFDVPFILRRSWLVGVDAPHNVLEKNKWLDPVFLDTMQIWSCGGRDFAKLDLLARSFGVGGKPEGVDGSMFSDLLKTDRATAEKYLENDLRMTAAVAEKMGIL